MVCWFCWGSQQVSGFRSRGTADGRPSRDHLLRLFLDYRGRFRRSRTFYVLQYWDQFALPTVRETLLQVINLTDGGLVVYGSFIGAAIAS